MMLTWQLQAAAQHLLMLMLVLQRQLLAASQLCLATHLQLLVCCRSQAAAKAVSCLVVRELHLKGKLLVQRTLRQAAHQQLQVPVPLRVLLQRRSQLTRHQGSWVQTAKARGTAAASGKQCPATLWRCLKS